ncbi:MAG: hypothetical protein WCT28_01700 [Patescibacteria group bacterium]|jgi:hypothetical protein
MLKKQRDFLRLRHAKDHDDGTLKNPLFLKVCKPRWMIIISVVLLFFSAMAICIGATYIPWFQIESVTVQGVSTINVESVDKTVRQALADAAFPMCSSANIYSTSTSNIESLIVQLFAVESAKVVRSGQSFSVDIQEKITTIALRTKEKTAMLDTRGFFVRDATLEESRAIDVRIGVAAQNPEETLLILQGDMPIVINTENESITELPENSAKTILTISMKLPTNGIHAVAYEINGTQSPYVRVDTTLPYDLYFSLSEDVDEQLRALRAVITANNFVSPKEYIDLRFGAYVYKK